MSDHHAHACPKCGGKLQGNGGFDSHAGHAAGHGALHGLHHGHPLFVLLGAGIALGRALFPEKLVCRGCGYSIKV